MDKGRLAELVPDAQSYILGLREYQEDVEALQPPIAELRSRMVAVMDFYIDLYCGLQQIGHGSDPIILEKVEATEVIGDERPRPAGVVEVVVDAHSYRQPPVGGGLEWTYASSLDKKFDSFDPDKPNEAVGLRFTFRATDDGLEKQVRRESSLAASGSDETALPKEQIAGGIMASPSKHYSSFNNDGPKKLEAYEEKYLRQRTLDIEQLEASRELIQEALKDPELNPWAEGLDLAALRRERAEAAYDTARNAWMQGSEPVELMPKKSDFGL